MNKEFVRWVIQSVLTGAAIVAALASDPAQGQEPGAGNGRLDLTVTGLRSFRGGVAVAVYGADRAEAFPRKGERATLVRYVPIPEGASEAAVRVKLEELPFGRYAIAVFHDEDGDKKMKTGPFGLPREGFGFSNDAKVVFGPPSFESASFDFAPGAGTVEMRMRYM